MTRGRQPEMPKYGMQQYREYSTKNLIQGKKFTSSVYKTKTEDRGLLENLLGYLLDNLLGYFHIT